MKQGDCRKVVLLKIASLILLAAIIGASVLTMHKCVCVMRQQLFEPKTTKIGKSIGKIGHVTHAISINLVPQSGL